MCVFLSSVVMASPARSQSAPANAIREAILQTQRLLWEDEGKAMVEYGLLVMLISLAAVTAFTTLWNAFSFFVNHVSSSTQSIN